MNRYIDADKLYKIFVNLCKDLERVYEVDAVEVVRCRDCKKYNTDDCMMIHGKKMNRHIFTNDFCSYGEKATNERKSN